jgi:hypothetical protein
MNRISNSFDFGRGLLKYLGVLSPSKLPLISAYGSHALLYRQFKELLKELDSEYGYKNNNNSLYLFQIINTPKLIL